MVADWDYMVRALVRARMAGLDPMRANMSPVGPPSRQQGTEARVNAKDAKGHK